MDYSYTTYGLTLRLPFPCPALVPAPADTVPDVVVTEGPVPYQLQAPVAEQRHWQAEPGRFLLRGGLRAGRFLVEGGQRVTLQRTPVAEDAMLGLHFLDSVLAAVLRQRGLLVLHADAAVTSTGAVAVAGTSGVGKSTTLAALLARGCTMLADDIAALSLGPDGRLWVLPGVPQLHLCADAAHGLGRDTTGLPVYSWQRMKAALTAHADMALDAAPLRSLFVLRCHPGNGVTIRQLAGAEKFMALLECIYGPLLPAEHPGQFPLFSTLAEQVCVYQVGRPEQGWTVDEVVDGILNR